MKRHNGFTLVEVAIAIVILGLLLGGAMMTLSAQMDLKNYAETQRTLALAQEAIIGFAAANGRLPCPADPGSTDGIESPAGGNCTNNFDGFVPAKTLGLMPIKNGQLIDAWGQPIRYAVTNATSAPAPGHPDTFTTSNGISELFGTTELDDSLKLTVSECTGTPCVPVTLTDKAVFVLMSSGKNQTIDDPENEEATPDRFFIYQTQTSSSDDLMLWASPFTLYSRMLAAGAL